MFVGARAVKEPLLNHIYFAFVVAVALYRWDMPSYDSRDSAREVLRGAILQRLRGQPDLAFTIADACIDTFRVSDGEVADADGCRHVSQRFSWVIRNDDLKAYDAVWAATAFVQVLLGPQTALPLLVPVAYQIFRIYHVARTKGAYLRLDQMHVLGGMGVLRGAASTREIADCVDFDEPTTESILESMEQVRCGDGSLIRIVAKGPDGLWSRAGV